MGTHGSHVINDEDNRRFCTLSGDVNPLHDQTMSRRLMFGGPIAHGVHVLLRALQTFLDTPRAISSLKADFLAPVYLAAPFEAEAVETESGGLNITVTASGKAAQKIKLSFFDGQAPNLPKPAPSPGEPSISDCRKLTFDEASKAAGETPLYLDQNLMADMFPNLAARLPAAQLATILGCSRIEGMESPGRNSVFVDLTLNFEDNGGAASPRLTYETLKGDERFSLVYMDISGPFTKGRITALYRPSVIHQASFEEIRQHVRKDSFAGQKALVIGGSRGLGEVCAKMIAAGGGEVCLTFNRGAGDAKKVADEIIEGGGKCGLFHWDALAPPQELPSETPAGWQPSHLYYFATPFIGFHLKSTAAKGRLPWDGARYTSFNNHYVDGLANTLSSVKTLWSLGKGRLEVFYPSTTDLDDPEQAPPIEYLCAKAAGEALCHSLVASRIGLEIKIRRLPTVTTDQTSLTNGAQEEPLKVLLAAISS